MSYLETMRDDARLRILQALQRQSSYRLGDRMLQSALEAMGHDVSLDWVRTQVHALANLGAVKVVIDTPAIIVAELTADGHDHVRGVGRIEGVRRPAPSET